MTDREIVERLARDVMGWEQHESTFPSHSLFKLPDSSGKCYFDGCDSSDPAWNCWNPLTSIADAWMLVERLRKSEGRQRFLDRLEIMSDAAGFPSCRGHSLEWLLFECDAPRAICMAALATLGKEAAAKAAEKGSV